MPAPSPGRVRLVVLNYDGGPLRTRCFEHLHALDWPPEQLELVLVDNASTDGSADAVAASFPDVRVLWNLRKTGFPANNLGLTDLERIRYVGLVNNDGLVATTWLENWSPP